MKQKLLYRSMPICKQLITPRQDFMTSKFIIDNITSLASKMLFPWHGVITRTVSLESATDKNGMLEASENSTPSAVIPSGSKHVCNPVISSDVVEAVLARQKSRYR
jgi:hypothetical protein